MLDVIDHQDQGPVALEEISARLGLSKDYLAKSMRLLSYYGLLHAVPGRKWGYAISRKAEEITLADIYDAAYGSIDLCPCVGDPEDCGKHQACKTRKVWSDISEIIRTKLNEVTLDYVKDSNNL